MQSEFRVGCFDAEWSEQGTTISHDNGSEIERLDFGDLNDLQQLCALLTIREQYEANPEVYEEMLQKFIDDLEA